MQTFGHHNSHKEHIKQIIEEENLETPSESVEFLQYVKKHQKKVEHHKQTMHSFNKMVFAAGIAGLGYMAVRHFGHSEQMHGDEDHSYSGSGHRLGAANEAFTEPSQTAQTFSMVSVAIWGMVVAKAKTGMEASTKTDSTTVGGLVSKVGTICALIAAASLCQFMGSMGAAESTGVASKAHKLQSGRPTSHPASYYDEESSHYMGGAHNALFQYAQDTMDGKSRTEMDKKPTSAFTALTNYAKDRMEGKVEQSIKIPDQEAMGGSHNVAMAILAEQSNRFMKN